MISSSLQTTEERNMHLSAVPRQESPLIKAGQGSIQSDSNESETVKKTSSSKAEMPKKRIQLNINTNGTL